MTQNFLDHPCKETCSGWRQGYERGISEAQELRAENEKLKEALCCIISTLEFARAALKDKGPDNVQNP